MARKSFILAIIATVLPPFFKRIVYNKIFKYQISESSKIGFSYINIGNLSMENNSSIGHFNFIGNLDSLRMESYASIAAFNWITGFPTKTHSKFFSHQYNRRSELYMGHHSAITKRHHIDCTNTINIGNFTTIAGYYSQFLTHSIDIKESRQDSYPINVGNYCFIGTNCVLLGKATLPDFTVLGAKSFLAQPLYDRHALYAGAPAKKVKQLPESLKYFNRTDGFVY